MAEELEDRRRRICFIEYCKGADTKLHRIRATQQLHLHLRGGLDIFPITLVGGRNICPRTNRVIKIESTDRTSLSGHSAMDFCIDRSSALSNTGLENRIFHCFLPSD
jgi:hypothetical protein